MGNRFIPKDGQYYYAPHRSMWGIWQHHIIGDGMSEGTFIKDCKTKKEAADEVGRLNGWHGNNN